VVIFRKAAGPCATDFMKFIGSFVATQIQFYDIMRTIKLDARNISYLSRWKFRYICVSRKLLRMKPTAIHENNRNFKKNSFIPSIWSDPGPGGLQHTHHQSCWTGFDCRLGYTEDLKNGTCRLFGCPASRSVLMGGCKWTVQARVLPFTHHQCSIHWENSRVVHYASKRKYLQHATNCMQKCSFKHCLQNY